MDPDDERILQIEFTDDNLESMGYERPATGPLVLYDKDQQQDNEATAMGPLVRLENLPQVFRPSTDPSRLDLVPRYGANPTRESEPKPLLNASNLNININVNSEDAHPRRRAALPPPMGTQTDGGEAYTNGGTEPGWPLLVGRNRAGVLLYIACLSCLFVMCVVLLAGDRTRQHDPVQLTSTPDQAPLPIAPDAFLRAHDNLEQDLAQLEELFYRAQSALPPASSLRHFLKDGPQPQALREEVTALGVLHDRLVGRTLESEIARNLRVSSERLRAAVADPEGERGRWGSGSSRGGVRAERALAKAMSDSVDVIIADIETVRKRSARMCGRQPFVNARGSWTLSDDSTCPRESNQWQLGGGSTMSLGNGVSDAEAAFGFINWICRDLDTLTALGSAGKPGSIAVEARRGLVAWEQLLQRWGDLEAAVAANDT